MGSLHIACLASFLAQGHRVVLYSYSVPDDLPEGIECRDANVLIPEAETIRHRKTGSLSLFADLLRYELLRQGAGLYVDCDMYCLRPVEDAEYIFGWQSETLINNAVLKLPPDCPALRDLCSIRTQNYFVPPWYGVDKRLALRIKRTFGVGGLQDLKWGTVGPQAVTHYLRSHKLSSLAKPPDVYYPVAYNQTHKLLDPTVSFSDIIANETKCVHLFRHFLQQNIDKVQQIPVGCPLDLLLDRSKGP